MSRIAGYHTSLSGKWHVTKKVNPKKVNPRGETDKHNWRLQRGFGGFTTPAGSQ